MDLYRTQSNTKAVRTHKRRDFTLINDRRTFGGECARLSARDSRCRPYEILCTLLVEEQTGLIHVIIHSHLVEKVKGSNASVWSGPDAAANDWRVADSAHHRHHTAPRCLPDPKYEAWSASLAAALCAAASVFCALTNSAFETCARTPISIARHAVCVSRHWLHEEGWVSGAHHGRRHAPCTLTYANTWLADSLPCRPHSRRAHASAP